MTLQATPRRQGLDGVQLHVVRTFADVEACRRWAFGRRPGPLFFDTESGGLNVFRDEHRMTQLGDLQHGWAFPARGWGEAATEILREYPGDLGAHNSPYDLRVLREWTGLEPPWHKVHDTLLTCHIKDSTSTAKLKPRAALDVDPRAAQGQDMLDEAMAANHWTWATVPYAYEPYMIYGAIDPVLSAHLWDRHSPEVLSSFAVSYELERATARICAGMMDAGMMIDRAFIEAQISEMSQFYERAMTWFRSEFGVSSLNSADQVERVLNKAGVPTLHRTATGKPSFDKETLATYAFQFPEQAPLIRAIARCRKTDSVVNRYLRKFLVLADGDIMHYQIWTSQARTGRMSVTDPPMQTYDREEPAVRGSYRPRPGNVFVTIDADQIEARMAAHFSGDERMIADFIEADRTGQSFFVIMASKIYGEQIAKKDPRYTRTKNATYGQIYGAGLDKAARTAGVPVETMRPVYVGTQTLYPGVGHLMNRLIRQGKSGKGRPHVFTLCGRRLYVHRGHEYALLNTLIQGSSAEILKHNAVQLDAAGYGSLLRLPMHDEFVLEVPREDARDVLHDVSRILTDRDSFRVPITWSGSILEDRWRKT